MKPNDTSPASNKAGARLRGGILARVLIATGVLAALVVGVMAASSVLSRRSRGGAGEGTLDYFTVARTKFDITTTSSGELRAKNQIEIRSRLESSSIITEVVPEGIVVKPGDLLVKLKSDEIESRIREERIQVESARADYDAAATAYEVQQKENESDLQAAQVKKAIAELELKQWQEGDKVQAERDNAHAISKAQAERDRLKEKLDKSLGLEKEGFLSTDELKRDKLAFEDAERALEKALLAKDVYDKYEMLSDQTSKQSDLDQATSELDRVVEQNKIQLAGKASARDTKRSQLGLHEERLAKYEEQLAATTIIAPSGGLVVYSTSMDRDRWFGGNEGPLQIGRQVHPNELLIVLPDTSEMQAAVQVHEALASRIRPGLAATVKVDAAGGKTFPGKVESIGVLAESGGWRDPNLREYRVKISLEMPPSQAASAGTSGDGAEGGVQLKPSMRCEAEILMGSVDDALAVPIQAVFNEAMVRYVYAPRGGGGGKYVRIPVKLGQLSERFAEVTSGVSEGMRVLLREPKPAEVIDEPWTTEQLAAVGLSRGEDGQIIGAGGGNGNGNGPGGAQRPAGERSGPGAGGDGARRARPEGAGGKGGGRRRNADGDGAAPKPDTTQPAAEPAAQPEKPKDGADAAPGAAPAPAGKPGGG